MPDDEFGEVVQAVVQPANWADATDETAFELLAWLRERLSSIKVPKEPRFQRAAAANGQWQALQAPSHGGVQKPGIAERCVAPRCCIVPVGRKASLDAG